MVSRFSTSTPQTEFAQSGAVASADISLPTGPIPAELHLHGPMEPQLPKNKKFSERWTPTQSLFGTLLHCRLNFLLSPESKPFVGRPVFYFPAVAYLFKAVDLATAIRQNVGNQVGHCALSDPSDWWWWRWHCRHKIAALFFRRRRCATLPPPAGAAVPAGGVQLCMRNQQLLWRPTKFGASEVSFFRPNRSHLSVVLSFTLRQWPICLKRASGAPPPSSPAPLADSGRACRFSRAQALHDLKQKGKRVREQLRHVAPNGGLSAQLPSIGRYSFAITGYDPNQPTKTAKSWQKSTHTQTNTLFSPFACS
ncbi:hypothetical protein niasHS_009052 [Heterodera schachtii]|uniref:Uncharacterized protein n=1 Tax=Heterodera schachtii TaxID=97005 RepID=A0ABD2J7Z5_HETSC